MNTIFYNKYHNHKHPSIFPAQLEYFKSLHFKMENKSKTRINNIKTRIITDITKNIFSKKYQISSSYEYKIIKQFVDTLNLNYNLIIVQDHNILKNKLSTINGGDYFCMYKECNCNTPLTFINEKTPVLYCIFEKK